MYKENIDSNYVIRPIKRISLENGDVLRAIKASDQGFSKFGEAYFSYIHYNVIKAWKLHKHHTANFICPMGKVKIILHKESSPGKSAVGYPKEFILSEEHDTYQCITVPSGIWYGFKGLGAPTSLIFSLMNGEHSPEEQQSLEIDAFPFF